MLYFYQLAMIYLYKYILIDKQQLFDDAIDIYIQTKFYNNNNFFLQIHRELKPNSNNMQRKKLFRTIFNDISIY